MLTGNQDGCMGLLGLLGTGVDPARTVAQLCFQTLPGLINTKWVVGLGGGQVVAGWMRVR